MYRRTQTFEDDDASFRKSNANLVVRKDTFIRIHASFSRDTAGFGDNEIRQVPSEQLDISHDYSMFAELEKLRDNQEELRRELDQVEEGCQEVVLWSGNETDIVPGHGEQEDGLLRVFLSETDAHVWEERRAPAVEIPKVLNDDDQNPLIVDWPQNTDEARDEASDLMGAEKGDEETDSDLRQAASDLVAAATVDEEMDSDIRDEASDLVAPATGDEETDLTKDRKEPCDADSKAVEEEEEEEADLENDRQRTCSTNYSLQEAASSTDAQRQHFKPMKIAIARDRDSVYHLMATLTMEDERVGEATHNSQSESEQENVFVTDEMFRDSVYHLVATSTIDAVEGVNERPFCRTEHAARKRALCSDTQYDLMTLSYASEGGSLEIVESFLEKSDPPSSTTFTKTKGNFGTHNLTDNSRPRQRSFLWSCLVTLGKILNLKRPIPNSSCKATASATGESGGAAPTAAFGDERQPLLRSH
mmetsp:Transcript_11451/g.16800  ORF Transcript_11451/g.16800 Transcript_11451/m.16800 type:complete len:475 (-) Transcript_11451:3085-4509(-)